MADPASPEPRIGRIEAVVLKTLGQSGGLTPRDEVLLAAYPELAPDPRGGVGAVAPLRARRARAEAAVSRALTSLERKGLVVRERNDVTGRTMIRTATGGPLPTWEQLARAEEDLAAHCGRVAREWEALARRARRRAAAIRTARSDAEIEEERDSDLEFVARLEGSA